MFATRSFRAVVIAILVLLSFAFTVDVLAETPAVTEFFKLIPVGGDPEASGYAVAISGDTALVGAPHSGTNSEGAVYVFRFNPDLPLGWTQETVLVEPYVGGVGCFGISVALEDNLAIVGAGEYVGAAYIFRRDDNDTPSDPADDTWNFEVAYSGDFLSFFGFSVAISGDTALVGAFGVEAAYVFRYDSEVGLWGLQGVLTASDAEENDAFGLAVAIAGDVAVVGASHNDDNGTDSGSAYVFRRDDNGTPDEPSDDIWIEEAKLLAIDGAEGEQFSWNAVSVDQDVVVVGAKYNTNENGFHAGAAYVFRYDPEQPIPWVHEAKLVPSEGGDHGQFGATVSVSGDVVLGGPQGPGDVWPYAFWHTPSGWTEVAKLITSDGMGCGFSVAIDGAIGLAGSPDLPYAADPDANAAYAYHGFCDCNDNGIIDIADLDAGTSEDENENGIPDECEESVEPIPALSGGVVLALALLLLGTGAGRLNPRRAS